MCAKGTKKKLNPNAQHHVVFHIWKITRGTNYGTQVGSKDFHCHKCGMKTHKNLTLQTTHFEFCN